MSTSAVSLDGLPLIGSTPGGGVAKVTGFDGWLTTSVRRGRDVLTGRHGGFSSPGLAKPREMTLSGLVRYSSASACAAERRAMLALGGFDAVPLVVADAGGGLSMTVVIDESEAVPLNDRLLRFRFDLVADDPFARSTTAHAPVTVAAGATVSGVNNGTAAADLLITLTSSGTVVLTVGGVTLTTMSLPSGTVIDTGSPADSLFPSLVMPIQMPALPAGGGAMHQAGTANLSVVTYDTYA